MRKYENYVQKIKSDVLTEVSKYAFKNLIEQAPLEIPKGLFPGPDPTHRCCVFHERAITEKMVELAIGQSSKPERLIEVIDIACDQCPVNRFTVTETCRACIAHRCVGACPVDAITIISGKAVIDYDKCIECGRCKDACPYGAISDVMRPCKRLCPTGAIEIDAQKKAVIKYDLCISCGACVYGCPFGAIQEISELVKVIQALESSKKNVYAMLAPSFVTQFQFVELGKVITGLKKLGFKDVVEVALGADAVTLHESEELKHVLSQGKSLTSSCCPGFVNYIGLKFPELMHHVSTTVSPMTAMSRLIKAIDTDAITVFIGPCIAKKSEKNRQKDTDYVLTFEELAAMIDARSMNLSEMDPSPLDNASLYGRSFAASGGVGASIAAHLRESGEPSVTIETADGIKACDRALKLLKVKKHNFEFLEGMACEGGCIKGPVTMHYGPKDLRAIKNYANSAHETCSKDAAWVFEQHKIDLETH